MKTALLPALFAMAIASPLLAQTSDGEATDYRPAGQPNQVMVLGTPHLSQLPDTFRVEMVRPVVERLAAWKPTAIATEDSSGLLCDRMRRMPDRYADAIDAYCFDPSLAGQATGLTVPQANARAEAMLADWPDAPSPSLRRELAAVFLAAGEPGSALVQWLRLPEEQRVADEKLTPDLVDMLDRQAGRKNETASIAAQVAAHAGLERLFSVDDQSTFMGPDPDPEAYAAAIMAAWDNEATAAQAAQAAALADALGERGGILAMYRAYNDPDYAAVKYRSDFGPALAEPSSQGFGRRYVAYWETRNLRMVANMREVMGRHPGTRMIAIVGASHKGYYEDYLRLMRDVEITDVLPLLQD